MYLVKKKLFGELNLFGEQNQKKKNVRWNR